MTKEEISLFKSVVELCVQKNLFFKAIYTDRDGRFVVAVQDKKKSGIEPVKEYMRDYVDYSLAYNSWVKRGIDIIAVDSDPYGAINLALDYLDKLDK